MIKLVKGERENKDDKVIKGNMSRSWLFHNPLTLALEVLFLFILNDVICMDFVL